MQSGIILWSRSVILLSPRSVLAPDQLANCDHEFVDAVVQGSRAIVGLAHAIVGLAYAIANLLELLGDAIETTAGCGCQFVNQLLERDLARFFATID
jgi:hypothetical protein